MPITKEKLDQAWKSRDQNYEPSELINETLDCLAFQNFSKPTSFTRQSAALGGDQLVGALLTLFIVGLKLGYEVAQTERLEELHGTV